MKYNNSKYKYPSVIKQLCSCEMTPLKTDCKFYTEQRDMCAIIPCCKLHNELGNCPCDGCENYQFKYATVKEKTANEMFKELGYSLMSNKDEIIQYKKGIEIIEISKERIYKIYECGVIATLLPSEIKAICKLLDEMEVK